MYLSNQDEVTNYFTIENQGLFSVDFSIDTSNVYTVNPQNGTIRGGALKIITVTLCLTEGCPTTTPSIIVRSVGLQTGACFEPLVIPLSRTVAGKIYGEK